MKQEPKRLHLKGAIQTVPIEVPTKEQIRRELGWAIFQKMMEQKSIKENK